jgi:hypothetical protein
MSAIFVLTVFLLPTRQTRQNTHTVLHRTHCRPERIFKRFRLARQQALGRKGMANAAAVAAELRAAEFP